MKKFLWILTTCLWLTAAGTAAADDTAIYGGAPVNVQPNVLIIFDTSISMGTADVPGDPYNPSTVYTPATYTSDAVYRWQSSYWWGGSWVKMTDSLADVTCTVAHDALQADGAANNVKMNTSSPYGCNGWAPAINLRMGNFLNFEASGGGSYSTRLSVAKTVVKNLFDSYPDVRWGLMRFNGQYGGKLTPHGEIEAPETTAEKLARIAELKSDVDALTASDWTPLAETLAEAGLYFAGAQSHFDTVSGHTYTYTSPIDIKCRPNFIIIMTDGEPTSDLDSILSTDTYLFGKTIGDYDGDGADPGDPNGFYNRSDYLDDVAKFLAANDMSDLGTSGEQYADQVIKTYTIGFKTQLQLLEDTATNGGGKYFTAESADSLGLAFETILGGIADVNAVFVAPVVPVSRMNRVFAGDNIYIGFFKPVESGNWIGNLKKFGLDAQGALVDKDGNPATLASGAILSTSRSYWLPAAAEADGPEVNKGGVGGLINNADARNIYTYTGTNTTLTNSTNLFTTTNAAIVPSTLGVATTTEKDAVIDDIRGKDKDWLMGDVLHSEPLVTHYDTDTDGTYDYTAIFMGTNWGMLHAFDDSTGAELWSFIPDGQLDRLKLLSDTSTNHDYFVDGSPSIYENGNSKTLIFGERRGGSSYYALDVSAIDNPIRKFKVQSDILGATNEALGQSWGQPQLATIATASGTEKVFLLPGGYDDNQDQATPADADNEGRAVLSVKAADGTLSSFKFYNQNYSAMTNSIVDLVGVDPDADGITNRIYAVDLGGGAVAATDKGANVFAFEDDNKDGNWNSRVLFRTSQDDGQHRKIFYSPDVIKVTEGEMIFFGTGDRADPERTDVTNRFYAVKNNWTNIGFTTLREDDLYDATANTLVMGNASDKANAQTALNNASGWYIDLEDTGEKMISSPLVYGGVVYFTTFVPDTGTAPPTDPCEGDLGSGSSYLYALDWQTGASVYEDFSDTIEYDPDTGEVIKKGGKADRRKKVGEYIVSAPAIAIRNGVAMMYIGIPEGIKPEKPVSTMQMNLFYWRELMP